MKKIVAIILAGGVGERFGSKIPKQFLSLNGKPIISYCIDIFRKHPLISDIVISTHPHHMHRVKELCLEAILVKGGKTRQESSVNALRVCPRDTDYVLIHDSVRPFIDFNMIDRCIKALDSGFKAVSTVIPSHDTIISASDDELINDMPDRRRLKRVQTPQAFAYKAILDAYEKPFETKIEPTDDIRYLFNKGVPCKCVEGSEFNIKVTNRIDLYLAERIAQILIQDVLPEAIDLTGKKY